MDYFKLKKMERKTLIKRIKVYEKRIYLLKLRKLIIIIFFFLDTLELLIIKIKIKEIKLFHRQIKGLNA